MNFSIRSASFEGPCFPPRRALLRENGLYRPETSTVELQSLSTTRLFLEVVLHRMTPLATTRLPSRRSKLPPEVNNSTGPSGTRNFTCATWLNATRGTSANSTTRLQAFLFHSAPWAAKRATVEYRSPDGRVRRPPWSGVSQVIRALTDSLTAHALI